MSITSRSEYGPWRAMIERCENPNSSGFKTYGARGIKVCKQWRQSFTTFLSDMGPRPSKQHSIDRWPDNDGNYEPTNCRWATPSEQRLNQRPQDDSWRVRRSWETGKRSRISPARINLTGMQFGKLVVLGPDATKNGSLHWLCQCDCGVEKVISGGSLKNGGTKSCGCAQLDGVRKHAQNRTSEEQRTLALKGWVTRRKQMRERL